MLYKDKIYLCTTIIKVDDFKLIDQKECIAWKYATIKARASGAFIGNDGEVSYNNINKITHEVYINKDPTLLISIGCYIYRKRLKFASEWYQIKTIVEQDNNIRLNCSLQTITDTDILAYNIPEYDTKQKPFIYEGK